MVEKWMKILGGDLVNMATGIFPTFLSE